MILDEINIQKKTDDFSSAIISDDFKLSYGDLKNLILDAAEYFKSKGIGEKDHCAILMNNSVEFIAAILALWQIKAVPIPLNTRLTKNEIEELINLSDCRFLIADENEIYSDVNSINFSLLNFSINNSEQKADNFILDDESIALIIFTSGSAGPPKGVIHTFSNLKQSCKIGDQILKHTKDDCWLASLPFYHIGGFSIIFRAFFFGTSLIVPTSLKIEDIFSAIENQKPTFASLVSTQLKRLLEMKKKPSRTLRKVLLGGGFIENDLIEEAEENGWRILKVYGSSETAAFIAAAELEEVKTRIGTIGKPLYPNKIFIIDENGKEASAKGIWEFVIESPALFKGYFKNEDETKKRLKNNRYFSGDIGWKDEDGYVYIEARRTDLIVTGGENVNPIEVENVLLQLGGVMECCVVGIEDKEWGHKVAAALVTTEVITDEKIRDFLREKIADYKIPKQIFFADKLPKTSLGKVQREKVKEMFKDLS